MKKVFIFAAMAAMVLVSCGKNDPKKPDEGKKPDDEQKEEPKPYEPAIKIDGDFSDWAALDASKVVSCSLVAEDTWAYPEIKKVTVYSDELYVNVYLQFNNVDPDPANEEGSHFALYINGDGNENTGGYTGQWDQGEKPCIDVLVMGTYFSTEGWEKELNCEVYKWTGDDNTDGWFWGDVDVSGFAAGYCTNKGMEFQLTRDLYPVGTWANEFSMGFQLQTNGWNATGALPNAEPTESNPSGYAPLLKITMND